MNERLYAIAVEVNGTRRASHVTARTLVDWLREHLHLTGTHIGCEHGVCGACSVMLDDEPVRSCLMYAGAGGRPSSHHGRGPGAAGRSLSVLQEASAKRMDCAATARPVIAAQALLKPIRGRPRRKSVRRSAAISPLHRLSTDRRCDRALAAQPHGRGHEMSSSDARMDAARRQAPHQEDPRFVTRRGAMRPTSPSRPEASLVAAACQRTHCLDTYRRARALPGVQYV